MLDEFKHLTELKWKKRVYYIPLLRVYGSKVEYGKADEFLSSCVCLFIYVTVSEPA